MSGNASTRTARGPAIRPADSPRLPGSVWLASGGAVVFAFLLGVLVGRVWLQPTPAGTSTINTPPPAAPVASAASTMTATLTAEQVVAAEERALRQGPFRIGDEVLIGEDGGPPAVLGATPALYTRFHQLLRAGDTIGWKQMVANRQVFLNDSGERAKVIGQDGATFEVRWYSGVGAGASGFCSEARFRFPPKRPAGEPAAVPPDDADEKDADR
jgi:hypothetical protein